MNWLKIQNGLIRIIPSVSNMIKPQSRKNRIVIPELIKKIRSKESDKENICSNNAMKSHDPIDENKKMKISQYLDQSNQTHGPNSKSMEAKTNQSTDRTLQPSEPSQDHCLQSVIMEEGKRKGNSLAKLEGMLRSDKMFVNPDKWTEFMDKAMGDEQFHKALNIFLYSYFIQNYN